MSDTQLIKDKLDIVDLISEYVQLKPAGVNHKGLCPFHHEKTPSFMASRDRQSFHCFGCGKGGDVFTFVQEMEGMEFVEVLKYLASKAGVQLTREFHNQTQTSQKNRLKDINTVATSFFHNVLLKLDVAKSAQIYLRERGLTSETIDAWHIGFIPDQWDLLTQYLLKKGCSIDDLVVSGLTIKRDNADAQSGRGFYDRFRGRIMFPIRDVHGAVVGFTGRVLVETETSGGKYVNTPQSPVYDKSHVVFGLYEAKKEIRVKDLMVMVEGQMDVIACHQAGMKNVVASSGTAMTSEQVHLLKRYTSNLAMAFDMDDAGIKAAKRGIGIAVADGMNVRVIQIPDGKGKDPDECLQQNPEVWFQAVKDAQSVMQWYVDRAFRDKNIRDPKQKQEIVNELLPEIAHIPFAVEQDHWMRALSSRIGVDTAVLRDELKRMNIRANQNHGVRQKEQKQDVPKQKDRLGILSERFLSLWVRFPALGLEFALPHIFSATEFEDLYGLLKTTYTVSADSLTFPALRDTIDSEEIRAQLDILAMQGDFVYADISDDDAKDELRSIMSELEIEWKKKRRKELQIDIERCERDGDIDQLKTLLDQFRSL